MRKLKIGFSKSRTNKIFSVLLQKYMNKDYSHCFVEYDTPHLGGPSIYHSAVGSGVGFANKNVFLEDALITVEYEVELSDELYSEIRKQLFSVCGKKYGLMQNVGIALVDLCAFFGKKIKNPFTKHKNCSELLYRYLIEIAYPEYRGMFDPDTITPADIEYILQDVGRKL